MSTPCTERVQPGDSRYCACRECPWHGPVTEAAETVHQQPCCPEPRCGRLLLEWPSREHWRGWAAEHAPAALHPAPLAKPQWSRHALPKDMEGQD